MMYDITHGINNAVLSSFADDTKTWRGVNSLQCTNLLQNELCAIYNWAHQNNKLFNEKKFQAIRFGELLDPHNYVDKNSNDIAFTQNIKDLGIIISADLSFDDHINIIAAKGKQMGG